MPYRRRPRVRKRPYRGRKKVLPRRPRYRRRVVPRGLRQAVIPFQREQVIFVNTKNALPGLWSYGTASGYHTIRNSMVFSLSQLPDITEFFTLFKSYKLNCVVVKIASLHNASQFTSGSAQNYYGANLQCYAEKNTFGLPLDSAITEDYWSQRPAKKSIILRGQRSHTFKIFPKVMNQVYLDSTHNMITQRSPPWIPLDTDGVSLPHFGLNMQFSCLDPSLAFDNSVTPDSGKAPINFKVTYKYYFQMRGVK